MKYAIVQTNAVVRIATCAICNDVFWCSKSVVADMQAQDAFLQPLIALWRTCQRCMLRFFLYCVMC